MRQIWIDFIHESIDDPCWRFVLQVIIILVLSTLVYIMFSAPKGDHQ